MNFFKIKSLTLIILFLTGLCFAADPLNYSVPLDNYSKKLLNEEVSRFEVSSTDEYFSLLNNDFQKVLKTGGIKGTKVIMIASGIPEKINQTPSTPLPKDLLDTRFLNLNSTEIQKAAEKFKGSPDTVHAIEDFVFSHISNKFIGIPLLPAKNILKNRSGDCTEHSVLAMALLRSSGIPSRAVVGMIFSENYEDSGNMFVYHMWVQAFYGGKWILVDATRPGKKFYNRYIAFTYHDLKTEMPLSYLQALSAIQNMKVRYIQ